MLLSMLGIVVLTASRGNAQQKFTELSGELAGTLTATTPYLVVGDVYVPPGSSVSIEEGAVLMFTGFTGLHVQGTLYAKGSSERPILFTSQYDPAVQKTSTVAPAPFDWNGIDIYESAVGSELLHCTIRYSVYGIRSQTEYCKINSSLFDNNGKSDFSIKDVRKEVSPGVPFSYHSLQDALSDVSTASTVKAASPEPIPAEPAGYVATKKKQGSAGNQIMRYAGLALGAGCGAYSAFSYVTKYQPAAEEFEELSDLDEQEMRTHTSDDWNAAKERRNSSLVYTAAGVGGALLGLLSFSISFVY